ESGRVQRGIVRNYLILDPTFVHLLTPLSSVGFAGEYQRMDYSPSDNNGHLDFQFYQGRLFYGRTVDPRTDIAIGVYGNHYQAGGVDSHANSGGIQANGGYNWTEVLRSTLVLQAQRIKFEESTPTRFFDTTVTTWAATFDTVYKQQISSYRFSLGRTLYPSSTGGLYRTDQVQGTYSRALTQRLEFLGALRYFRQRTIVGGSGDDTRNYATATLRM